MLRKIIRNSRGNAMIEIVPILAIFILIFNFALGFFGMIHSGILNSIAARNYAFETFRNRANLRYIRDDATSDSSFTYTKNQNRFHVIRNETVEKGLNPDTFYATRRPVKFSEIREIADENKKGLNEHAKFKTISDTGETKTVTEEGANPVWIKTAYGICLETNCGG